MISRILFRWGFSLYCMSIPPSFSVPSIVGLEVVSPVGIVVTWAALIIVGQVLASVTRRGKHWIIRVTGRNPVGWLEYDRREQIDTPERVTYTTADLKEMLDGESQEWRPKIRWWARCVVIGPAFEELTFRGIPYLLAIALGSFHLPLLVAGSALWAFGHTRNPAPYRRRALPVFVGGLLYLYLWLIGLWWLAIVVHAGNNLLGFGLMSAGKWWRRWQHTFSPGEEHIVTVDERMGPNRFGLYQGRTPDDEQLYVADVEPGEQTRVRVAVLDGSTAYAFPVSAAAEESD